MKGFKSTSTNPYTYTQDGVWKAGQYTFQAVVLSDSGYAFAFQRSDTTWQTVDLSWQVKDGSYSKIQWTFTLEVDAVAFRLIANTVTGETTVLQPMLEKGSNGSTPIAHEEDLRGMDGDNHEFIFTRNTTGIAPTTPLSTQDDDYVPEDWTDNPQGVTPEIPFEFVSMREKKNGVWLDFSPPSLWAKWAEDGLSVNLLVEGHYKSHWEGTTKVVEIVGGVDVGGSEVVKVSAVFRKGEENIAATVSQSRGFQWYVNGVHLTSFDNQPFITLDETYGDGFTDYVVLSYLVNSIREEERREIINISEGMDGIGEEFIFKANNSGTEPPVLPQTTDVGYQNDDYHGDWSDDPVAPTELNQFVWVAKRKKIGGIWEAFGTPSVWTKWVTDGEDGKGVEFIFSNLNIVPTPPAINEPNYQNDNYTGLDGSGWYNNAIAPTAINPTVYVSKREKVNGVWGAFSSPSVWARWVEDGKDAVAPIIIDGFWAFWDDTLQDYVKSSFSAVGDDGHSPYVDGGYWYQWNASTGQYENTNIEAKGEKGDPGDDARSILLTATSTQIHVDKNGAVPASITVTSYSDTITPDSWEFSVDGASFSTNVPSCVTMTSYTLLSIDTASANFKTLSIRSSNIATGISSIITINRAGGAPYVDETTNTWWTWDDAEGAYTDTGMSPVGLDGRIPYPAGYWEEKTYTRDANYAPYVQHTMAVYLLVEDEALSTDVPGTSNKWKAFNTWQAVFVDSLVAAFAKIGGAVFTGNTDPSSTIKGRMISEMGVDGTANFSSYTGDSGAWQPKLMLDFLSGRARLKDAEITGTIYATSGDIGEFEIGNKRIGTVADEHSSVGDGLAIYDDFIKFSKLIADADGGSVPEDSYVWVGIGENVFPATSGSRGLARYENHEQQGYWGTQSQTYYAYSAYQAAGSPQPATFYYWVYDDRDGSTGHNYSSSTYYTDEQINNHYYPFIYGGYFQHIIADVPVWYPYSTNYGVIIDVKGAAENIALDLYSGSIAGLAIRTRRISSGTTLTRQDVYVSCYNSSAITVYLPANPQVGKIVFVRRVNSSTVTVNGNGKTINHGTGTGTTVSAGEGVGDVGVFVYDGQFWMYSYLVRKPS